MQNRKRDTVVQNRFLDSVGEGEGGMFRENSMKQVYYQGWNRSPAQVGCMRQVLGPGALGRPKRIGWRGRRDGGLGWGTHVNPWLIHVNVWQKPLQYCKVISLQLIKINGKKNFNSGIVVILKRGVGKSSLHDPEGLSSPLLSLFHLPFHSLLIILTGT